MSKLRTMTFLALALANGPACFAQLDNASMLGTVSDASGAVFPGATVTIQNQGTSATTTLTTDENGSYIAPVLPVGAYRVTVGGTGFKTVVRENIRLRVADRTRVDFRLEPGEVTETVAVTSEAPLVEGASTTLGGVIAQQQV